jgi:hypothetical protein
MTLHWIEQEFARTGLPKSGLAAYLGVDNAAISRTVHGERQLTPEEKDLAVGFFSIVAKGTAEEDVRAIQRLRTTKIRDAAGLELARWMLQRLGRRNDMLRSLLERVAGRTATLATDQIVALCRVLGIDIVALVGGHGIYTPRRQERGGLEDVIAELDASARRWVASGVPYQFNRRSEAQPSRSSSPKGNFVTLQPAEASRDDLASCAPYLVPDDSYAPRFEQGQTIYLADSTSEPRRGDYVAAILKDSDEAGVKAVLGKLLYVSRDQIGISSPRYIRNDIARQDVTALRRIAFCKI